MDSNINSLIRRIGSRFPDTRRVARLETDEVRLTGGRVSTSISQWIFPWAAAGYPQCPPQWDGDKEFAYARSEARLANEGQGLATVWLRLRVPFIYLGTETKMALSDESSQEMSIKHQ